MRCLTGLYYQDRDYKVLRTCSYRPSNALSRASPEQQQRSPAREFSPDCEDLRSSQFFCAASASKSRLTQGGTEMTWKTPKIAEIAVGLEINMYACAVRK